MADRSHLTPVTTTDRRGRTTTVYRNLASQGPEPKVKLPSVPPATGGAPAESGGTPLPAVPLRDNDELHAFLSTLPAACAKLADRAHLVMQRPEGRAATSLAMDLIDSEALPHMAAMWLLAYGRADEPGTLALDSLRVAERLRPSLGGTLDKGTGWANDLIPVVRGCRPGGPDGPGIASEEGLDSTTAAVAFILSLHFAPDRKRDLKLVRHGFAGDGGTEYSITVQNQHLKRLLQERPHEADRITAYVAERGMHRKRKRDVDELRAWLDEQPAAVSDGWL